MSTNEQEISQARPAAIRAMFDAIAPTYDRLNRLMSFGLDLRWRRKAVCLLAEKRGGAFLDIAAGSGDVSRDLLTLSPRLIVAADFALRMLEVLRTKPELVDRHVQIAAADALRLPFSDESFDGTIVAFGMRNFADRPQSLREMIRVLKPGGISVILELTTPRGTVSRALYAAYSRIVLPFVGQFISKHNSAYRYLPQSIAEFPSDEEFLALMTSAGFNSVKAEPLSFGSATIYWGKK